MSYTKGPWHNHGTHGIFNHDNFPSIQNSEGISPIRGIDDPENDIEVDEILANADLISSAPDMLTALKAVTELLNNPYSEVFTQCFVRGLMEAAIKKAEGRN